MYMSQVKSNGQHGRYCPCTPEQERSEPRPCHSRHLRPSKKRSCGQVQDIRIVLSYLVRALRSSRTCCIATVSRCSEIAGHDRTHSSHCRVICNVGPASQNAPPKPDILKSTDVYSPDGRASLVFSRKFSRTCCSPNAAQSSHVPERS